MPDLLLDALPVIDLLEITGNTSAVAQLIERDQSSVSRIYRQASDRLGLQFCKGQNGDYRAGANQALLQELRRSSQRLRLHQPASLRWLGCPWSPAPDDGAGLPRPLAHRWISRQRLTQQLRDHLIDLAVLPGLELLPEAISPDAPPQEVPLACGDLVALPLLRQPLLIAAPAGHPLQMQTDHQPVDLVRWPLLQPEPIGDPAPRLRQQLRARGLSLVEGKAHQPLPAPLQLLASLDRDTHPQAASLRVLPINSGLQDLDVVVMRRDLREEPALVELLDGLVELHHQRFGQRDDLQLLR